MIELVEGVPGSGKSYYAVSERFLTWLRSRRKIYIYVDGIYLDKLAAFEGRSVEDLQHQLVLWQTADEVRVGLVQVESGAAVLIDEAQTIFRAKEKVDPQLLRWLETHRHRGNDVVLMVQHYGQLTLGVTRLVEVTTKFRRLDRLGLKNRYQGFVRGNPEETEVIRKWIGKYDPKVYTYYSSYAAAAIKEQRQMKTVLGSVTVIAGLCGLGLAGWWLLWGNWIGAGPKPAQASSERQNVQNAVLKEAPGVPAVTPIRIVGGVGFIPAGKTREEWRYLTDDGRMLTVSEIAALSGGTVSEVKNGKMRTLVGPGVIWAPSEPVSELYPLPGGLEALQHMGEY